MANVDAVIFDLDDTLFPEREYAFSGLAAVAEAYSYVFGDAATSFTAMRRLFDTKHRSKIFDTLLSEQGYLADSSQVRDMVETYRRHRPTIRLHADADACLSRLQGLVKLGLLTDGPSVAQRMKIDALGLWNRFDAILLTDELGAGSGKPNRRPFELIAQRLAVPAHRCVYVADNPAKDFIAPNQLGWRTVRIIRPEGVYENESPPEGGSPLSTIHALDQLDGIVGLENGVPQKMKYIMVLPDGAADEPVEQLGGKTPLEAARKPAIDRIAQNGHQGLVTTVPAGFAPGSDVATLSLFGYDPHVWYSGRAPLEAAARGIPVQEKDLIFRCNLVTVADGRMADFTAGHISQGEADRLIADLNQQLAALRCRFFTGVSYRNLMVAQQCEVNPRCTPPHDIPDQPVADHLPRGAGAEWVREVMTKARALLVDHEINRVRLDLGENPATDIWLWGQGRPRVLEPFAKRFGVSGAVIAAVDLIRGIARSAGLTVLDVPGATGYLDTDYAAKGKAAVAALDRFDLVVVHIEAPDEAGHQGDLQAKITAIERIDEHIVAPVLEKLRTFDAWRILIAPDHPTPVSRRVHTSTPPPFCMAGTGVKTSPPAAFSESAAAAAEFHIDPGHRLVEGFLAG